MGSSQGSVLGPVLFCRHSQAPSEVIFQSRCGHHKCADNTLVRRSSTPFFFLFSFFFFSFFFFVYRCLTLRSVLTLLGDQWRMTGNRLKLNNDKTEGLLVGYRRRVSVSQDNHLRVGNHDISFKGHVENLGVYTDAVLFMVKHTDHISRSAYLEIRRISSIRHLLTTKAAAQPMCSFVLSQLDYCNSLFIDIKWDQMYRLQKVQCHAAKVVFRKSRHVHVRPLLKALHWLPVKDMIIFKIATFVFRVVVVVVFYGTLPPYLSLFLSVYTPSRTLRSSSDGGRKKKKELSCARWKLTGFGYRSFSVQAPLVWNNLPAHIRHCSSLSQFKTSLKTTLFTSA